MSTVLARRKKRRGNLPMILESGEKSAWKSSCALLSVQMNLWHFLNKFTPFLCSNWDRDGYASLYTDVSRGGHKGGARGRLRPPHPQSLELCIFSTFILEFCSFFLEFWSFSMRFGPFSWELFIIPENVLFLKYLAPLWLKSCGRPWMYPQLLCTSINTEPPCGKPYIRP